MIQFAMSQKFTVVKPDITIEIAAAASPICVTRLLRITPLHLPRSYPTALPSDHPRSLITSTASRVHTISAYTRTATRMSNSSSSVPVHILIVGAGAVGCFYASKLQQDYGGRRIHVSLVCRSNYKAIAANGVSLETHSFGNYHFAPYKVFASIAEAASYSEGETFKWDYVVVTTKALPDVTNDAHDIRGLVKRGWRGAVSC